MLQVNNVLQTLQEPYVNLSKFLNTLNAIALFQCLCNSKNTQVGGVLQCVVEVVELGMVVTHETVHALTNHTESFLDHLFERTTDRHNLTYRLHRRAYQTGNASELREVPARNLTDHIIQTRSHISR